MLRATSRIWSFLSHWGGTTFGSKQPFFEKKADRLFACAYITGFCIWQNDNSKSFQVYACSLQKKNFVWRAHTRHTTKKQDFCQNFDFFSQQHPIFVGPKMCFVCARQIKIFFSTDYMHILKNFYYYHFPKCKTLLCTYIKSRGQRFFPKNGYFEPIIATPPNETKSSKFVVLPGTHHIYFMKHFQIYA